MGWFYIARGVRHGPFSRCGLARLVLEGVVRQDTLIWRTGLVEPFPAGDEPALFTGEAIREPCADAEERGVAALLLRVRERLSATLRGLRVRRTDSL